MKRLLTLLPLVLTVAACGGSDTGAMHRRRQGPAALPAVGHQPEARLPEVRRRLPAGQPEHPGPDREQELGRLLERPRPRLHRRDRARRVHRPPRQVPAVRHQRGDRAGQHARDRHEPVPAGAGRPVEVARRQAVRPPEGLGHRRAHRQRGHAGRRRPHQAAARRGDLEPDRRRHVRADGRQAHGRQERQARRRAGLRPEQRQGLRARLRPQRPHLRADDVGRLRRQPRLQAARQEPVGHEVQLRRPALRADLHLVAEHDPQGLHAAAASRPARSARPRRSRAARPRWRSTATGRSAPTPRPRA